MVACLAIFISSDLQQIVQSFIDRKDSSRLGIWQLTIQHIKEHPFVGLGMRTRLDHPVTSVYMPHNIYLATAFYIGIPGGMLFMAGILGTLYKGIASLASDNLLAKFGFILLLCGLLSAVTDFGQLVRGAGPFLLVFWMPIAFVIANDFRKASDLSCPTS